MVGGTERNKTQIPAGAHILRPTATLIGEVFPPSVLENYGSQMSQPPLQDFLGLAHEIRKRLENKSKIISLTHLEH